MQPGVGKGKRFNLLEDFPPSHAELSQIKSFDLPDKVCLGTESSIVPSTNIYTLQCYKNTTVANPNPTRKISSSDKPKNSDNRKSQFNDPNPNQCINTLNPSNNPTPNTRVSAHTHSHSGKPPGSTTYNFSSPGLSEPISKLLPIAPPSPTNPRTSPTKASDHQQDSPQHTHAIPLTELNERLPDNGGETDLHKRTNDPPFLPGFEPSFIFSAQPQEPTKTKFNSTFGTSPNLPTCSPNNPSGPPHNSEPHRVYFSNLSPSC